MAGLLSWACAARPLAGEVESGDLEVVSPFDGGTLVAVMDGLGHGGEAASASRRAAEVLTASPSLDPVELLQRCHEALRGSRGVAAMVVSVSARGGVAWAGVGNVEAWLVRHAPEDGAAREALISAPGVVGYQLPTVRRRDAAIEPGDVLALATDGIHPRFAADISADSDPADNAELILARHGRPNDDALVLIARYGAAGGAR
jgi:negative regulator of sigma-B (phosphoserine phosphatase)